MAKRSVAFPFSRLLLSHVFKNPMDAIFRGFPPSSRNPNLSLLGALFCSTSSSRDVRNLLAELKIEKQFMESVAIFPSKYFNFVFTVLLPDKRSVSFILSRMEILIHSRHILIFYPFSCSAV